MASVASQLIGEVNAHAQRDSLEDAREICADGTYFPNKLRTWQCRNYNFAFHLGKDITMNIFFKNAHQFPVDRRFILHLDNRTI
jgi:hypothetical protein